MYKTLRTATVGIKSNLNYLFIQKEEPVLAQQRAVEAPNKNSTIRYQKIQLHLQVHSNTERM